VYHLDKQRTAQRIAQRDANLAHANLERRFRDLGMNPASLQQTFLADQFLPMFEQVMQHAQRLRPERQPFRATPHLAIDEVQTKRGKIDFNG
jgi:hypothetical protein